MIRLHSATSGVSPAICGMRWRRPGAGRMRTTAAIAYPSAVGVEVGVVAADPAGALEPLDTLGHGRRAVVGAHMATDVRLEADELGVGLAFANAVLFAACIVLAHRLSREQGGARFDGLAASMLVAAVALTAFAGWGAVPSVLDPVAIVTGIGVGVASSVIPPTPSTSWPWRVSAAPPTRCW